ncbi:MAG: sigma-70 family RNA polymerase sigma factor [Gemmataceae bacterium]|nr:sigma-70 family RNA polymerase sigma factor [Gemmataceae bacterium]
MPASRSNRVLRCLRKAAATEHARELADRELLERMQRGHDEAVLAALVRRHGPMVLRLCLRVLRNQQDAEDAFQATFLVLSRKAASLGTQESLAGWLYSVAYRIAQKARVAAARRRKHEGRAAVRPAADPLTQITLQEAHELLDRELARLPDKFRMPLVLCYLEGLTRDEAALQLGWPASTLKSRLEQARQRLQARLAARGLALSGALVAMLFCEASAAAVVSPLLLDAAVRAGGAFASGQTTSVAIPVQVLSLAKGAMRTMAVNQLKSVLAMMLAVAVLAGGIGAIVSSHAGAAAQAPPPEAKPLTSARNADAGAATRAAQPAASQPDTEGKQALKLEEAVQVMRWSRDGRTMVSRSVRVQEVAGKKTTLSTFRVWDAMTGKLKLSLGELEYPGLMTFDLSPDGKMLAISQRFRIEVGDKVELWDVDKGTLTQTIEMEYARSRIWFAFAPDNRTLAVCGCDIKNDKLVGTVRLFDTGTGQLKKKLVCDGVTEVISVAMAADGKLLALGGHQGEVVIWDLAAGKARKALNGSAAGGGAVVALAFSPDSRQLASAAAAAGVTLWDLATGTARALKARGDEKGAHDVVFSANGRYVAADGWVSDDDKQKWGARVWDVRSGELLHERTGLYGFGFTPDSARFAILRDEKTIELWPIAAKGATDAQGSERNGHVTTSAPGLAATRQASAGWREAFKIQHEHPLNIVACSAKWIAAGDEGGNLFLYDAKTGKDRTLHAKGGKDEGLTSSVDFLQFSPDGKHLFAVTNERRAMSRLNLDPKADTPSPGVMADHAKNLGTSADGEFWLEWASANKRLLLRPNLWTRGNTVEYESILHEAAITHAVMSADDKWLTVVTADENLRIHERASLKETQVISLAGQPVNALQFSKDGKRLAVVGPKGFAKVYDPQTGKEVATLKGHGGIIFCVAFSPDGKTVVTGGDDNVARLWDAASGERLAVLEGHTDSIRAVAFDSSGTTLFTGSADKSAKAWRRDKSK